MKQLAVLLLFAAPASAQLLSTVGPQIAPIGGEITIAMSNDTPVDYLVGQACPFSVRTPSGQLVYDIDCPTFAPIPLPPGGVATFGWPQYDNNFQQVPAGLYVVTVEMPDGSLPSHLISIGGTDAGVAILGAPLLGKTRGFRIQAPGVSFLPYLMAASLNSAPGVPTCGGVVPLFPDAVFKISLNPANPFFTQFQGTLGFVGESWDPAVAIPNDPTLSGAQLVFAFAALDFTATCPVAAISSPLTVVLQ